MSSARGTPRSRDMDFLKSIVENTDSDTSKSDDQEEVVPWLSYQPPARPSTIQDDHQKDDKDLAPRSPEDIIKVKVNVRERKSSDSASDLLSPNSRNSDADDQKASQNRDLHRKSRSPRRPLSSYKNAGKKKKMLNNDAARLEQKYLELRDLLLDNKNSHANLNPSLVAEVTATAQRYHLEAHGLVPGSQLISKRRRLRDLLGRQEVAGRKQLYNHQARPPSGRSTFYSPGDDNMEPGSYILIDGTGSEVKTRKVTFAHSNEAESAYSSPYENDDILHMEKETSLRNVMGHNQPSRGRVRQKIPARLQKKNAWGSATSSKGNSASSQKSTPRQKSPRWSGSRSSSRSVSGDRNKFNSSNNYSESFTSDSHSSESRSRSRSRSKGRIHDLHLKYSENPKLLEWLKEKDKKFRETKRKERKVKLEKRKAEKKVEEERQTLKEKSEKAVEMWIKEKRKSGRLLRRRQKQENGLLQSLIGDDAEELVVVDEVLDLKEHGVKVDPSKVPKSWGKAIDPGPGKETTAAVSDQNRLTSARPELSEEKTTHTVGQPGIKKANRPQSAANLIYSRPTTGRRGRFAEGAKAKARKEQLAKLEQEEAAKKKRINYDEWLQSKRKADDQKKADLKKKQDDSRDSPEKDHTEEIQNSSKSKEPASPKVTKTAANNGNTTADPVKGSKTQAGIPKSAPKSEADLVPTPPKSPKRLKSAKDITKHNAGKPPPEPDKSTGRPRPIFEEGKAYDAVKHEQKSWDKFADYIWSEAKREKEPGEGGVKQPEPPGPGPLDKGVQDERGNSPAANVRGTPDAERQTMSEDDTNNVKATDAENKLGSTPEEEGEDDPEYDTKDLPSKGTDDNRPGTPSGDQSFKNAQEEGSLEAGETPNDSSLQAQEDSGMSVQPEEHTPQSADPSVERPVEANPGTQDGPQEADLGVQDGPQEADLGVQDGVREGGEAAGNPAGTDGIPSGTFLTSD